ncbi:PKD domain-containing protein [Bacteroidota bacterium]|nr:PKD domain-containing protein [Bacteroidota bacterium]
MKKILLVIGVFSIYNSGISQSNSCSISVSSITDNTLCGLNSPFGFNGAFEFNYNDSVFINSSDLSFQLSDGWGSNNSGSLDTYAGLNDQFGFYNLEPGSYTLDVFYDDGNGYICNASTTVTIADYSTSNITVTAGGDIIYPNYSFGQPCNDSSNGFTEIDVDFGQPPYYYTLNAISAVGSISGVSNADNFIIDNLPSGSFSLDLSDDNFCNPMWSPSIDIPPLPSLSTSHDTICLGDSVLLDIDDGNILNGNGSFMWPDSSYWFWNISVFSNYHNFSPSQSGYYTVTFDLDTNGNIYNTCYDSVYIEVLNNSIFSEVLTLCDSIVWNGVTYDSSGVYSDTLQNSLGCDSVLILDVTFAQPTYGNETLTACDSVTWNGITYDSSGTFIDTIPNHLGCDSIVTVDVNLVGDYDMRFLVAPVSLIAPPFTFPFINATPNLVNYDFTWDFGDGTVIATNDTNITHEYQYNGVYTVKLIAEDMVNNCGVDTLEKVNLINCSGGPSLSIEEAFNNLVLYPNPARYVVNIDYGTEKDYSNHFVEIVNSIGQVVFTNMMNSSKTQISVSELGAKGLYFINIRNESNEIIVTKHLIIN